MDPGRLGLYTGVSPSLSPTLPSGSSATIGIRHHFGTGITLASHLASRCQAGGHQAYLALCASDTRCQLTAGDVKRFEAWRKFDNSIHPAFQHMSLGGTLCTICLESDGIKWLTSRNLFRDPSQCINGQSKPKEGRPPPKSPPNSKVLVPATFNQMESNERHSYGGQSVNAFRTRLIVLTQYG